MNQSYDNAIDNIGIRNTIFVGEISVTIACLIRKADWRPIPRSAVWWKGKEVSIIGADVVGNFFLRHCDGSVRYWSHSTSSEQTISRSVVEFAKAIK